MMRVWTGSGGRSHRLRAYSMKYLPTVLMVGGFVVFVVGLALMPSFPALAVMVAGAGPCILGIDTLRGGPP